MSSSTPRYRQQNHSSRVENGSRATMGSSMSTTSTSSSRIKTNYKNFTPKQSKTKSVITPRRRKEQVMNTIPNVDEDDSEFQTEEPLESMQETEPENDQQFFIIPKNHFKISAYEDKYFIRFATPGTTNHTVSFY